MYSYLDPRNVLKIPLMYNLFQEITGSNALRHRFIQEHLPKITGSRVLEIGCGTGANLQHLPQGTDYTGYDMSEQYIQYARKKYSDRGQFFCAAVGKADLDAGKKFDVILVIGLLHHLSDDEILILCEGAKKLMKPGACLIAMEPCYNERQSRFERYLTSKDRGEYIREVDAYNQLIKKTFPKVESHSIKGSLIAPNSACSICASMS